MFISKTEVLKQYEMGGNVIITELISCVQKVLTKIKQKKPT